MQTKNYDEFESEKVFLDPQKVKKTYEHLTNENQNLIQVTWVFLPPENTFKKFWDNYRLIKKMHEDLEKKWGKGIIIWRKRPHMTFCGFEAVYINGRVVNKNFANSLYFKMSRENCPPIDFQEATRILRNLYRVDKLQTGGFNRQMSNPWDKRKPYFRSFSVRDDGILLSIWWSVDKGCLITPVLMGIRQALVAANILHKYFHDNDGFNAIGLINPGMLDRLTSEQKGEFEEDLTYIQSNIRTALNDKPFTIEDINLQSSSFLVKYKTPDLSELLKKISLAEIRETKDLVSFFSF